MVYFQSRWFEKVFYKQVVEGRTANGRCIIRVKAHALPRPLPAVLEDNESLLRRALAARNREEAERPSESISEGECTSKSRI